jgi:hypothetical protein
VDLGGHVATCGFNSFAAAENRAQLYLGLLTVVALIMDVFACIFLPASLLLGC